MDDLVGSDTFGDGGHGGSLQGGASGAGVSGGSAGRGGTGTGGTLAGGSSGKSTGGVAGSSDGGAAPTGGGKGTTGGSAPTGGKGSTTTGGEDSGGSGGTGGSGGSVNTGGSSGAASGGSTTTTGGEATGGSVALPPELIDNMEDADQNIVINVNGSEIRNGAWYTAFGKGGAADPVPMKAFMMPEIVGTPGAPDSLRAMHFVGTGGTEWGAMAAFDFKASVAGAKVPYDSGSNKGITFWAKAAAAANIQVRIPIPETTSGACATDGCENHYASPVALTTAWKKFTLLWTPTASNVFNQDPAWGYKTAFDRAQILSVQFVVLKGFSADFWIDDVSFVP